MLATGLGRPDLPGSAKTTARLRLGPVLDDQTWNHFEVAGVSSDKNAVGMLENDCRNPQVRSANSKLHSLELLESRNGYDWIWQDFELGE